MNDALPAEVKDDQSVALELRALEQLVAAMETLPKDKSMRRRVLNYLFSRYW